jgi:peptidase M15-like protein
MSRIALGALALTALSMAAPAAFDTRTPSFDVTFHTQTTSYRDRAAFVLPGSSLMIEASGPPGEYSLDAGGGAIASAAGVGDRRWQWRAPREPGLYNVKVAEASPKSKEEIALHVFVMVPATDVRDGVLNGYRIGAYPSKPLNGNPVYRPPAGFIEVTKANEDTRVSPHFRLKQFICKEDTTRTFPKYVVLDERLLIKLEAILERLNGLGYHLDTLHVMSGYRTPYYNRAIGDVLYSMHQWGSAADIYVDGHDRGQMDDLNHDGRIDVDDARTLYDLVEGLLAEPSNQALQGGMGFYPATAAHPPFVHVDVRGTKARWRG